MGPIVWQQTTNNTQTGHTYQHGNKCLPTWKGTGQLDGLLACTGAWMETNNTRSPVGVIYVRDGSRFEHDYMHVERHVQELVLNPQLKERCPTLGWRTGGVGRAGLDKQQRGAAKYSPALRPCRHRPKPHPRPAPSTSCCCWKIHAMPAQTHAHGGGILPSPSWWPACRGSPLCLFSLRYDGKISMEKPMCTKPLRVFAIVLWLALKPECPMKKPRGSHCACWALPLVAGQGWRSAGAMEYSPALALPNRASIGVKALALPTGCDSPPQRLLCPLALRVYRPSLDILQL